MLYVNHGLHSISGDGGETLRCYGEHARGKNGVPRFTAMCEPSAVIAEKMQKADPQMAGVIAHTGYKFASSAESALNRRQEYRRLLGVSPDTCLVGLFGSRGENSLFHTLGEPIFDACLDLLGEGYQFLFSAHPNEYEQYDEHISPMGLLIESQRERGMLVRHPKEDFVPYMAACDIVISDFSSMAESAMLFRRKLVFSPYPDGLMWKHSLAAKARRVLPTLESAEGLRFLLGNLRHEPLDPFIDGAREGLIRPDHDAVMAELTARLLKIKRKKGPT